MPTSRLDRILRRVRRILLLVVPLILAIILTVPARASGVVGSGSGGSCTEAALNAALSGGGTVSFNCGGAHTITISSQKTIGIDTVIDGGGQITLSGGSSTRILYVNANRSLTLQNITLRDGNAGSGEGGALLVARQGTAVVANSSFLDNTAFNGGAIAALGWNSDDVGSLLTVSGSTFTDNIATAPGIAQGGDGGGAIYIVGGTTGTFNNNSFNGNRAANGGAIHGLHAVFSINDSTFTGNIANNAVGGGGGGAIYYDGTKGFNSTISIDGSTFSGNHTNQLGGAMFSFPEGSGATSIDHSTFTGNYSDSRGQGGAIYHQSATGAGGLTIDNSTFRENYARAAATSNASQGGALWIFNTAVTITNSTFAHNDATHGSAATMAADDWRRGFGGALVTHTPLTLLNTTFVHNTAGFVGGALAGDDITAGNTIVAHNSAGNPWDIQQQCTDSLLNNGGNLQYPQKTTSLYNDYECLAGVTAVDPLVGTLGDYGGPTATVPLLDGSPAIDAGSGCPTTDQRGYARNGPCDSGAFEFGGGLLITNVDPPWFGLNESAPLLLTISGAGFSPNSVVRWDGGDLATTYVNGLTLRATVPAVLLANSGNFAIIVYDPDRDLSSAAITFAVVPFVDKTYLPLLHRAS